MSDDAFAAAQRRFSAVAIALHWAIAILIVMNLVIGFRLGNATPGT